MVAEEYNDPAGVYKVQTFGTLHIKAHHDKRIDQETTN
jgi:hypothetical protein